MLSEKRKLKLKLGANIKGLGSTTDGWMDGNIRTQSLMQALTLSFIKTSAYIGKRTVQLYLYCGRISHI